MCGLHRERWRLRNQWWQSSGLILLCLVVVLALLVIDGMPAGQVVEFCGRSFSIDPVVWCLLLRSRGAYDCLQSLRGILAGVGALPGMRLDLTVAQVLGHFVVMLRVLSAEPAEVWRPVHVHVDVCLRIGALWLWRNRREVC